MDVLLAGGIFVVAYALIASERFDRTLVALLGGLLVVVLGVVDQEEAFAAIDFNVIFLLAGMMILAGGLARPASSSTSRGLAIHRLARRAVPAAHDPRGGHGACSRRSSTT